MVYSAKSDDTNTISQFTRLKYIHITTNGTSTPNNYQVKLTIAYEPEMQSDFSDIRFNTLGHVYIDYWIESKTNGVTATVWVELPDAISHPGSDTIWMYYGNSSVSSASSIGDTFIFGDDFSGDLSKWTVDASWSIVSGEASHDDITVDFAYATITPDDFIIEYISKAAAGGIYNSMCQGRRPASNNDVGDVIGFDIGGGGYYKIWKGDGWVNGAAHSLVEGNYYSVKAVLNGANIELFTDDGIGGATTSRVSTSSATITTGAAVAMQSNTNGNTFDNYRVRKFIANEPTISYGTAQHQRRVPQFIG